MVVPGAAPGRKGSGCYKLTPKEKARRAGCYKLSAEEKALRVDAAKSASRKLKGVEKVKDLFRFGTFPVSMSSFRSLPRL